jgi:hypothetical protein
MAGLRRFNSNFCGLQITNLTHHDNIRALAQK